MEECVKGNIRFAEASNKEQKELKKEKQHKIEKYAAAGGGREAMLVADEAEMQDECEGQCAAIDGAKNGSYNEIREEKQEQYEKARELIEYIRNSEKRTPVKAYIHMKSDDEGMDGKCTGAGNADNLKDIKENERGCLRIFGCGDIIAFGEWDDIRKYMIENSEMIDFFELEVRARNSAVELLDIKDINARIEPGAIIRENVQIGKNAVIMMGAVINIGAVIGEGSMIDMGAVIGAGAVVGEYCHVGAGAVLAGMVEPMCKEPVTLERGVMIGANAVVLEGCRIGADAAVAAGAVVTGSLPAGTVAAGVPARIVKQADEQTRKKTAIVPELRG